MGKKERSYSKESMYLNCKCGEQIEIIFTRQSGSNEKEEIKCPNCKREHSFKSSMAIKVENVLLYKR